MLGSEEDHIVGDGTDQEIGHVKRLSVELTIYRAREQLREGRRIHVGCGQGILLQVLPGASNVIVVHEDTGNVADGKGHGGGCGGVSDADSSDGVNSRLCARGEETRRTNRAGRAVSVGAAIHLPDYAGVIRIVEDRWRELLSLR